MSQRDKSNFINMRKLHLSIKYSVLKPYVSNSVKLFDVSVGRYGDMHNYYKLGIRKVVGIDPDNSSIEEAKKRSKLYKNLNSKLTVDTISNPTIDVTFHHFDIVTCHFTMHYLFESKNMLHNSIKNISDRLRSGGHFIGTTLDGSLLGDYLGECEYVRFQSLDGSRYKFHLIDNKDSGNYFEQGVSKTEYRVCLDTLREVCEQYGLKFVSYKPFDEYEWDRTSFNQSELWVSSLYCTFVFVKN